MQPQTEQIHSAAFLAWRNAKRFFKDAKALIANQSYGHAFGLLALAEEEAGKALIFRFYADGYLRNPQWLAIATAKHEAKHATMGITVMLRLLYFFMFGLAPNESPRAQRKRWLKQGIVPGTIRVLRQHLQDAAQDLPKAINTAADMVEELSHLGQLQLRREQGFFVDFHDASGEPTGPHEFSKADADKQLQMTKVRLSVAHELIGPAKLNLRQRKGHIEIDTETRDKIASFEAFLFGRKGLRVILEWLAGHEPKEWVRNIRGFAVNEQGVKKVREVLSEVLRKPPLARFEMQLPHGAGTANQAPAAEFEGGGD